MTDLNDYTQELLCSYKGETYSVRDNGSIMRHPRPDKLVRKKDNLWTFGEKIHEGYLLFCSERVHRIVALAFHGNPPTSQHVVDHIDTNRQNNRPENLRYLTRLENILNNEITRRKVEYICGSIEAFLNDPNLLFDHEEEDRNFGWMRRVSKEEAHNSLVNIDKWLKTGSDYSSGQGFGEWIFEETKDSYHSSKRVVEDKPSEDFSKWRDKADLKSESSTDAKLPGEITWDELLASYHPSEEVQSEEEKTDLTPEEPELSEEDCFKESLTENATQMIDWKTPTEFPQCPADISGGLQSYMYNLQEGRIFSKNVYGEHRVIDKMIFEEDSLVVMCESEEAIKPYSLSFIKIVGGHFGHGFIRTYFQYEGALKKFTELQGKEWTGGEVFDDYC